MSEVEIYGEIVPFHTDEKGFCNLSTIKEQLKKANGNDVLVRISSVGGDVDEGFAIYSELRRYAKDNNVKVITLAEGRCASIATIIFLAGDERIVTEYTSPFVHNAWVYAMGDSNEIMRTAVDLEKCNDKIAKHYESHTNLSYAAARELMDNDTSISPDEALQLRFATKIEEVLRPVALQRALRNKTKPNIIMRKKRENSDKTGKRSFKANLFKMLGISNKIVFDATDSEVDFYELSEDDVISVGDKANIAGQSAEGTVVMANGETYVFESGELKEIVSGAENLDENLEIEQVVEEVAEISDTVEDLEARLEELEEEVLPAVAKAIENNKKAIASIKAKQRGVATRLSNLSRIETAVGIKDKKTRASNFQIEEETGFSNALKNKLNKI